MGHKGYMRKSPYTGIGGAGGAIQQGRQQAESSSPPDFFTKSKSSAIAPKLDTATDERVLGLQHNF